eukprot:1001253-Rhodomonas_salina.2
MTATAQAQAAAAGPVTVIVTVLLKQYLTGRPRGVTVSLRLPGSLPDHRVRVSERSPKFIPGWSPKFHMPGPVQERKATGYGPGLTCQGAKVNLLQVVASRDDPGYK